MSKRRETRNIALYVCIILIAGCCVLLHQFVKTNTDLIKWDYDIVATAFEKASVDLSEGEKSDREVLKELGDTAFKPIWQTRDLTKPLLISKKWYSSDLDSYLFECTASDDLTDQEVKALAMKVDDIAVELKKIKWEKIRSDGKQFNVTNKEIFEVIGNIDEMTGE